MRQAVVARLAAVSTQVAPRKSRKSAVSPMGVYALPRSADCRGGSRASNHRVSVCWCVQAGAELQAVLRPPPAAAGQHILHAAGPMASRLWCANSHPPALSLCAPPACLLCSRLTKQCDDLTSTVSAAPKRWYVSAQHTRVLQHLSDTARPLPPAQHGPAGRVERRAGRAVAGRPLAGESSLRLTAATTPVEDNRPCCSCELTSVCRRPRWPPWPTRPPPPRRRRPAALETTAAAAQAVVEAVQAAVAEEDMAAAAKTKPSFPSGGAGWPCPWPCCLGRRSPGAFCAPKEMRSKR